MKVEDAFALGDDDPKVTANTVAKLDPNSDERTGEAGAMSPIPGLP